MNQATYLNANIAIPTTMPSNGRKINPINLENVIDNSTKPHIMFSKNISIGIIAMGIVFSSPVYLISSKINQVALIVITVTPEIPLHGLLRGKSRYNMCYNRGQ